MQPQTNTPPEAEVKASHPVNRITPVSKYLAMLIFVALPFIGAYIGYQYGVDAVPTSIETMVVGETQKMSSVGITYGVTTIEDLAKDYRIVSICEDIPEASLFYAEKPTGEANSRYFERKVLLFDTSKTVSASFEFSDGLEGAVKCLSIENSEISLIIQSGEMAIDSSEYLFVDTSSKSLKGSLKLFSDNNGAWQAKKSMMAENDSHRYRLLDEPTENSRNILIFEEKILQSDQEGPVCDSISECLSAASTVRVLKNEVVPVLQSSFEFVNVNNDSVEINVVTGTNKDVLLSQKLEM